MMSRLERNSGASELLESRHSACNASRRSGNGSTAETSCTPAAAYLLQHHIGHREYFSRSFGSHQDMDLSCDDIGKSLRNPCSGERVTLKMDVSFSDHSFIIGRGGKGIQGVMRETGCHIHFPDSNRNHRSEKSNQVSVAGPPAGVVAARQRIREHLPISLAFMVDKDDYRRAVMLPDSAPGTRLEPRPKVKNMIEALQNEFRMTITWLPMENFSCAMVTVRGRRSNFERIREGLRRLTTFLRPGQPPPYVHLGIEVSPHHLTFVLGTGEAKIRTLMNATRTQFIMAPVRSDTSHHIPTVRIFGQVDDVYHAWLAFMDLLPVVLHIDIPDAIGAWRGRIDAPDDVMHVAPWPSSSTSGDGHHELHRHRVTLEQLQELRELGVVSPEALTAAVAAAELDGDIGVLHPVFRSLITLTAQLNSMLHGYEISLMLRLGRDSRHWKMVAKGPEKHVDLLIDVYRAIRDSSYDPIALLRNALLTAPPPTNRSPISPLALSPSQNFLTLPSSMGDSSTVGDTRSNSEGQRRKARETPGLSPPRCSSTISRHHFAPHEFGCVPCEMLGSQETCEMFAKLLKISRELSSEGLLFGHYTITPFQSSALDQRKCAVSMSSDGGEESPYSSTPVRGYVDDSPDHYLGGRYFTTSGVCSGTSSGLHHINPNGSLIGPDCGYFSGSGSEYSPWNGAASLVASTSHESSAARGTRLSFGDSPGLAGILSPTCSTPAPSEGVGGARRRSGDNFCTPIRRACGEGFFDGFPLDGRGDGALVKEFDAAPGAGRDHRYM
ncbi:hypothetical protein BIW11_00317 [Tropilaelaps mercedesae]|uniref:K Homology domain-containing protein n=1 Tax=Tropilaelaps mercedesae TaxID=418985 RepID=A0A1V9XY45_9ACAR|nr:hypothetical protein BIW11_00317 [Tropilaelaps mercedesae]